MVLEDAELDEAVAAAAFGAFMHQGQICMSTERIIVVDKVYDEFMKKFVAKTKSLPVGDPTRGNFPIGACVDTKTVDHVKALIADATARGAKLATGGTGSGGAFFEPTVVEGRDEGHAHLRRGIASTACRPRCSGPRPQRRAQGGPAHRLRHLSTSNSPHRAGRGADALWRHQGPPALGRFGGKAGIAEFTDLRWISIATQHRHYPI